MLLVSSNSYPTNVVFIHLYVCTLCSIFSEHLVHFFVLNLRVKFSQALLVFSKVIIGAIMGLGMSVRWTENETTLARNLQHTDLLGAMPALVFVSLIRNNEIG